MFIGTLSGLGVDILSVVTLKEVSGMEWGEIMKPITQPRKSVCCFLTKSFHNAPLTTPPRLS
jgi:hypothetical protein